MRIVGLVFEPDKKPALTKNDIITMLQAKGIEFNSKATKAELEALLSESEEQEEEAEEQEEKQSEE